MFTRPIGSAFIKYLHCFLLILIVYPTITLGSEIRVDSTGGLTTILTDETANLDLFMDGNPAGLILLDTHDRLDLACQWDYSNAQPVTTGSTQKTFSTLPRLSDNDNIHYEGWIAFPKPHWAFQIAEDFNYSQGQPYRFSDSSTSQQYRSLLRTAYDLGPFCVGLDITNIEQDATYDPGLFDNNVGIRSGNSGQNQTLLKMGVIATFPENPPADAPRWRIGGVWASQVGGNAQNLNAQLYYLGSNPFSVGQVTTYTNDQIFGSEILYEIPHRLMVRITCMVNDTSADFAQTVSQSSVSFVQMGAFPYTNDQSVSLTGAFRSTFPLSGQENLKLGGSLSGYFYNEDLLNENQSVYDNQNKQWIGSSFGVGLEAIHDYAFGLQFKSQTYLVDKSAATQTTTATLNDYNYYQLALGGEKWLSDTFAYRMGLTAEEDVFRSGPTAQSLNTSIDTGLGIEEVKWAADFKFMAGQIIDVNNSTNTTGYIGAELSGTVFLQ